MVRMKALQDKCKAKEGVICRYCKHQEYKTKERDQYKEVVHILNVELMEKSATLEHETHHYAELSKPNTNLTMELGALCEQTNRAKADTVVRFQTSQPYYDECGGY